MNTKDIIIVGNSSFNRQKVKGKDFAKLKKLFPKQREDVLKALADKLAEEAKAEKEEKDKKEAEAKAKKEAESKSRSDKDADK